MATAQAQLKEESRSGSEFIALVALTTSLVAMSIDTMLPALGVIAADLGAREANDRQLIVSAFLAGLTAGQFLFGPISDSTGRKLALYSGIGLFVTAAVICAVTPSFTIMLVARALQGLGAASGRVVSIAIVRDRFAGRAMARVMSFVNVVFILVPIVAPSVGQGILLFAHWRVIFWALCAVAIVDISWFALRQAETLPLPRRVAFSPRSIGRAVAEVLRSRITFGYMLASGFIFGAFINYLTTSQQIFQDQYGLGRLFPLCFGSLALSIGLASFTNGKLVMRFGMRELSKWALRGDCVLSLGFLGIAASFGGHPPFAAFMTYMLLCFFCNGLLFGNFSARAMEPMGHIAGVAAAVISSGSNLMALTWATLLGRAYNGTVLPLVGAFALFGLAALAATEYAERTPAGPNAGQPDAGPRFSA